MTSLKSINRRVGSLFAVAALVLATVTPGLVPAFASAAQVTERSVELSSSSKGNLDTSYLIKFKAVGAAEAFAVEFCQNSPLINSACTPAAGFSSELAETDTADYSVQETTAAAAADNNAIAVTSSLTAGEDVEVQIDGITNPAAAGTLYARIVTYATEAAALSYQSTALGTHVDEGSAAVSITDTVGVSGAVLESLTFCVAGNAFTGDNCTRTADAILPPTLRLGEETGATSALSVEAVSQGNIYSQLSTNAAGGAVVKLKSGNDCGGLKRINAADCDIAPTTDNSGIEEGQAKFGILVVAGSDPASPFGTLQIANATTTPYYSTSVFKLNYDNLKATGVTSPFGDSILDTAAGPVSNKNAQITFGASVSNNTPAGLYSNDFSLIATGKF